MLILPRCKEMKNFDRTFNLAREHINEELASLQQMHSAEISKLQASHSLELEQIQQALIQSWMELLGRGP